MSDDRAAPQGGPPQGTPISASHNAAKAHYDQVLAGYNQLKDFRRELDHLTSLGDTVTTDDIVKSAASLVGSGVPAQELAVILSTMPQGGEALQQWVLTHDQQVREMEANAQMALIQARHLMGVMALHVLMEDHLAPGQTATSKAPPPGGAPAGPSTATNPLTSPSASPLTPSSPTLGNA